MSRVSGIIIEGVTGTGKSSTIDALRRVASFELFDEEATFDDFMTAWTASPGDATNLARARQLALLDRLAQPNLDSSYQYVLERFHLSQYALGSEWYADVDERCAALGCKIVLLMVPVEHLRTRSLYRAEYAGDDWQSLVDFYGSESNALEAIQRSQQRRLEALQRSVMEHLIVDTSAKVWQEYAERIARWRGWRL
jgi:chloramphenicol 3-O-phosphotransferase